MVNFTPLESLIGGLLIGLAASTLEALQPFRLFDSRTSGAPRRAGSITEVTVAGAGGSTAKMSRRCRHTVAT